MLDKIVSYFNITLDELVYMGEDLPKEVSIQDKIAVEHIKLIQESDQEEKTGFIK